MKFRKALSFLFFILFIFLIPALSFALSEDEKTFLAMYFSEEELVVVSSTRSLQSITRVAENVEVVMAADIELMNAHTVAEALNNVTGIEIADFVGPGTQGLAGIHGSDYTKVAVLLDGVPLQNSENAVSLAILPVQIIEKIEIIKGPASSTWGSSFGGVINIITKSVSPGDHVAGTAYASGGEHSTSDLRAEVSGRKDNIGIYLFGGTLNSDGFQDKHGFWHNNFFSKLTIDAGEKTKIDLSFLYHKSNSVSNDYLPLDFDAYDAFISEHIYGKAALSSALTSDVDLNVSAWMFLQNDFFYENTFSTGQRIFDGDTNFKKYGLNGNFTWRTGQHTVVAGGDVMAGRLQSSVLPGETLDQNKYALFINDTIKSGIFSITPGIRYDNTNIGGAFTSPSLGVTCLASKDLLLRLLVSRGFHDPRVMDSVDIPVSGFIGNPDLKPEKIWSYQAGAETNILNIFRAKLTVFLHDIDDLIIDKDLGSGLSTVTNVGRARSTGGEIEIATNSYKGFKLKAGVHYENIKLLNFSDERVFDSTRAYGFNTALTYNSEKSLRAILEGHYMWWNDPAFWEAKYNGFIMDFNIIEQVLKKKTTTLDVFFTAHNIFNGSSYSDILFQTPRRWLEAGMRFKF